MANCRDCIHFAENGYFGMIDLCTKQILTIGENRAQDCRNFEEKIEQEKKEK